MIVATGALRADYRDGALHEVRVAGVLVADRVHVAVRDPDWGTVALRRFDERVRTRTDGFSIDVRVVTDSATMPFAADLSIEGDGGAVRLALAGRSTKAFPANRIGFCVLHPRELAGVAVAACTPVGWAEGAFPAAISPHQPFTDLVGLRHGAGPGQVEWRFRGELFETEDQRNWTDPSFKTYCPPLREPFPRTVAPDTPVRQEITLVATGSVPPARAVPPVAEIRVADPAGGSSLPEIGFALPATGARMGDAEAAEVAGLHPAHLRVVLDAAADWAATLHAAAQDAHTVGSPLDVEVVSRDEGGDVAPLLAALAGSRVPVRRVHVFDAATSTTGSAVAAAGRRAAAAVGLVAPLGGGSRANYAELNRAELPLGQLDVLTYPISPQVHAFDDASVIGTLAAQEDTLVGARRRGAGRPVVVGPVTLLPRFNPVATTGPVPVLQHRPPPADPRQRLPLTAAWTVGSLAALRTADAVTYFETTGPGGLLEAAERFGVYEVFAALSAYAGGGLLEVQSSAAGVAALGVHRRGRALVLLANLTPDPVPVAVHGWSPARRWLLAGTGALDERGTELPGHAVVALHGPC